MIDNFDWSKAKLQKVSVRIDGHSTSISLEPYYIDFLKNYAAKENISFTQLVQFIDKKRIGDVTLSAALRFFAFHLLKGQISK
ncbi:ribbon-helix-helix domain-containing protein [Bartonella tamiae]|nr:ribbon-helix-helix domain-containing protein [Bartonella tamiae]